MITVYSSDHYFQDGKAELHDGKLVPCFESPRRADLILKRIESGDLGPILPPQPFEVDAVRRIHAADFVEFLCTAWSAWTAEHGHYDALPLNWLAPGMRRKVPDHIDGKLGFYSFDAATPITAGTWRAITAAANVALTGAHLVADAQLGVFALCRPPGHHAGRAYYGGYCFFNNAAIAAQALRDCGASRVAILDVDYHHGNGTQDIFYDRGDVFFASLHADPMQEFPYFLGYEDETGMGAGEDCTANYPLPWGTGWARYAEALDHALGRVASFGAEALVVSLGVDTYKGDPISKFLLESPDFLEIGRRLAALRLPTLFVLEGGYAVEAIGVNVANVLQGFEETR